MPIPPSLDSLLVVRYDSGYVGGGSGVVVVVAVDIDFG